VSARIIAISAPPGGGKSTVAAALAERLGAALVEYDAYDTLTERSPEDIAAWLAAGGAYDAVDVADLVADLETLRDGGTIRDRRTGEDLAARSLVILDTPFGRAHPAMAPLIETALFLDTPPDVALARKVREFVALNLADPGPGGHRRFLGWLDRYLLNYEQVTRPAIAIQRDRVLPLADLVIPAADAPLDAIVEQAVDFLVRRAARKAKPRKGSE
jgi:uridine kinase